MHPLSTETIMAEQLTESLEDYLEAIAELIAVEGHAHAMMVSVLRGCIP